MEKTWPQLQETRSDNTLTIRIKGFLKGFLQMDPALADMSTMSH